MDIAGVRRERDILYLWFTTESSTESNGIISQTHLLVNYINNNKIIIIMQWGGANAAY